jgi:hypothetical protein
MGYLMKTLGWTVGPVKAPACSGVARSLATVP